MKNTHLLLGSILLLFGMLWLPLGQYDFLIENWMKIGTYAVPFLLLGAFALTEEKETRNFLSNYRFLGILMLIAYIIHQFEEHWVDLLGHEYAFYTFNNNFILGNLGEPDSPIKPLTREAIFVINTSLVWLVGAIGILRSPKHVFPLIAMASIIIVNAVVHVLAGLATFQYNPGILTSVLIFTPLYVWVIRVIRKQLSNSRPQLIAGIIWAFLGHVVMVGGLLAANWFHLIPEMLYFGALVVWSLVPLLIYRPGQH